MIELSGRPTLVLGLGNPLMGDDGLGQAVLEGLRGLQWAPGAVLLVDGGTWGMNLLPEIEDAGRLLLVDSIDQGRAPGTLIRLERHELPRFFSLKLSPHQVDLREVLALAELRGTLPVETVAIGVQPESVELRIGLSATVEARVPQVVDAAVRQLAAWGHDSVAEPAYA